MPKWFCYDPFDGVPETFDTEKEALDKAQGHIENSCVDSTWDEEVENIVVGMVTHEVVKIVLGVRADMTEEAWGELTVGGEGDTDEWWDFQLKPTRAMNPSVDPKYQEVTRIIVDRFPTMSAYVTSPSTTVNIAEVGAALGFMGAAMIREERMGDAKILAQYILDGHRPHRASAVHAAIGRIMEITPDA